jgi:hypothetical protein
MIVSRSVPWYVKPQAARVLAIAAIAAFCVGMASLGILAYIQLVGQDQPADAETIYRPPHRKQPVVRFSIDTQQRAEAIAWPIVWTSWGSAFFLVWVIGRVRNAQRRRERMLPVIGEQPSGDA